MDSLTQIVLGAAVGEAVLGKKVGNKALLWGAVAGTIPDLDVLYIKLIGGGAIDEIVLHRGISHSILFAIVMAPILGWLVNWLYRKQPEADYKGWTWLFFWSIFTHPLLDCLTTYGTQLFLPFSDHRVSIASVFVVDLFYTVPFLLSVIALLFIKRTSGWRRKVNYFGVALSSTYLIAGLVNKLIVAEVFENDLLSESQKPKLVFVGTTPLNIILWYGVAETDSTFQIGYHSLFDQSKDVKWVSFQKNHYLIKDIENDYGVERLRWFSDQLYIVSEASPETYDFYTLKFGRSKFESTEPIGSFSFYFRIHKNTNGELEYESIRDVKFDTIKDQLEMLVDRILGNQGLY
ncbi:MAG: metal-dependent hydrolase [Flavobacteriales bacterium]|nr:metal-dependent hydrolase [Flavobacteriales bacterium]